MNIITWWNQGNENDSLVLTGNFLEDLVSDHARNKLRLDHNPERSKTQNLYTALTKGIPSGLTPAARKYGQLLIPLTFAANYILTSQIVEYLK
ncbi:hypothetical protein ISS07_05525 [Candidatus Woesearchaeota archaeon]|nr:hypothetical protein [Candidatus Woesearchaeota archaeon]